jgi:hypothetical protein
MFMRSNLLDGWMLNLIFLVFALLSLLLFLSSRSLSSKCPLSSESLLYMVFSCSLQGIILLYRAPFTPTQHSLRLTPTQLSAKNTHTHRNLTLCTVKGTIARLGWPESVIFEKSKNSKAFKFLIGSSIFTIESLVY